MSNLFLALFLVAILALIVGLISPKLVIHWSAKEKRTRGRVALIYGTAIVVLFIAFGITSPKQSSNSPNQTAAVKPSPSPGSWPTLPCFPISSAPSRG
jgi:uncharacterized membrane protein